MQKRMQTKVLQSIDNCNMPLTTSDHPTNHCFSLNIIMAAVPVLMFVGCINPVSSRDYSGNVHNINPSPLPLIKKDIYDFEYFL